MTPEPRAEIACMLQSGDEPLARNPDGSLKKNGRREPLRSREDLVVWINRKGEHGGFAVDQDTLRTIRRGREYFTRNGQHGLHSN